MKIPFVKFQGTGNDFIIIDNREGIFPNSIEIIQKLTDRRFGIGADGLMLIEKHPTLDFRMRYYNVDGSESLCGNGSRCAIKYAQQLGIIDNQTKFETTDGEHKASIKDDIVSFELHDLSEVLKVGEDYFINNGSPHHMTFVDDTSVVDVSAEGRKIRNSISYQPDGTNVNFVQILSETEISVRTFERGVEDETLSCGTGVTASAIAANLEGLESPIRIQTLGGQLSVSFEKEGDDNYHNIFLSGPATFVYEGKIEI
jgi:diaminopimelate epimerase